MLPLAPEEYIAKQMLDRLRTIIGYDRICVMDAGEVAEFDTPVNLYQKTDGIFRGMCEHSNITLEDIRLTRKLNEDVE